MNRAGRVGGVVLAALVVAVPLAGCGSGTKSTSTHMTLYTCATENVEQAVVHAFEKVHRGTKIDVYRAATGQLNARVAADVRSGGIKADVIWACDPLTMHGYDSQGLLAAWKPPNAAAIPARYRSAHFVGVDVLYMIVVVHHGTAPPQQWSDLAAPQYRGSVALPSPTFAASALGLLGYFASARGYGVAFYKKLKGNGAVQVNAPTDTLTGVEQGRYRAGVTLANVAYADAKKGSPIAVSWPRPGGVAIYAPIGVTTKPHRSSLATQFASFAASRAGQSVMAAQDTYVTLPGIAGPPVPAGSPVVSPNWSALFGTYQSLLTGYAAIFSG